MQELNWGNVLKAAFKPVMLSEMINKLRLRLFSGEDAEASRRNLLWLNENRECVDTYAKKLDPELWSESLAYSEELNKEASAVLDEVGYDLGGGGCYPFLYFITRYLKPNVVLETGVAAGFSSSAFLGAIRENGHGTLYSSDFPYFRLPNPEKYIGIIVPEHLKQNWNLFIKGDRKNIPDITSRVKSIDLFHYDSDKSYKGREFAREQVSQKMSANGVILFDDIQDNAHFHDLVSSMDRKNWKVFEFEGKYFGLIGEL